jgi:MoaA/NifB/PqqE/SkfB family radical SAM enzyme
MGNPTIRTGGKRGLDFLNFCAYGGTMLEIVNSSTKYPFAMVNITNRCNLFCKPCFVLRKENPIDKRNEMKTSTMLEKLVEIQKYHGILLMLWMGGEPLLRPDVLREGVKLFSRNTITTNGTIDLLDLPQPNVIYAISIDGPPELNDAVRGNGTFEKVMKTLSRIPDGFKPTVMCNCTVTKMNEDHLEELIECLLPTRIEGITFTFYVPRKNEQSELTWGSTERRDKAVRTVLRLKEKHPTFIWNRHRSLELTLSENCRRITDNCPTKRLALPLYLNGDKFVLPFCCYGNESDCDLCGAWVVFKMAASIESGGIDDI